MAEPLVVGEARLSQEDGECLVSAAINVGRTQHTVTYRLRNAVVVDRADAFLAAALLPGMAAGSDLRVGGTVSPRLLAAVPTIQDVFHCWDRDAYRKVTVKAEPASDAPPRQGAAVGCFFSGGLDSFYTLLKHREEITHLIFIHGFDIKLTDHAIRDSASRMVYDVAAAYEKSVIEVATDVRDFSDRYVEWELSHGAILASVALLLSPLFSKVYLAASNTYLWLLPWGSHPLIDPLWSNGRTEIVHDGCEAMRIEKLARIVGDDTVLRSLRVCWENRDGAYNCGRCEKCLRMMVELRILGALDRCTTFNRPLDLTAVSRIVIPWAPARYHYGQLLKMLEQSRTDLALARALQDCLSGRYYRGLWPPLRAARNHLRRLAPSLFGRKT